MMTAVTHARFRHNRRRWLCKSRPIQRNSPYEPIISVKVLDSNGNGNIENVIKGTKWIINNKDIYNIKIVNISFGTTTTPPILLN